METKPDMSRADSSALAEEIVRILYQKGASDIKLYRVEDESSITDYQLIAAGRSSTHVKSLADELDFEMSERGVEAHGVEGKAGGSWILLDYITVIVHIFDAASREFYRLERLQKPEHLVDIAHVIDSAKLN